MFIYHLYILFGEISVHIFCSFLIAYFWFCCCCCCCCFWQLRFENSLYSTDLGPSLDVWFANIVSHSVAFPLMLCKGFLKKQFFILMRFSLSSVPFMEHVFGIKSMNSLHVYAQSFSCVLLIVTSWTAAHQAPLSMGFSRQKYWSGFHILLCC